MLRVIAWGIWIQLLVFALDLSIVSIPYKLTQEKGQLYVSSLRSVAKSGSSWSYALGKVEGRGKPVQMAISSLLRRTDKYGHNKEEFKRRYVNTGVPIEVLVGTYWFTSYDVAYAADDKGKDGKRYTIPELFLIDGIFVLVLIAMYVYLRRTAPPAPPEDPYINQPGGF